MSRRSVRTVYGVFLILYTLAVIWPGQLLANRVQPLVLGLPFALAWVAGWIVVGLVVLWFLDWSENRFRQE